MVPKRSFTISLYISLGWHILVFFAFSISMGVPLTSPQRTIPVIFVGELPPREKLTIPSREVKEGKGEKPLPSPRKPLSPRIELPSQRPLAIKPSPVEKGVDKEQTFIPGDEKPVFKRTILGFPEYIPEVRDKSGPGKEILPPLWSKEEREKKEKLAIEWEGLGRSVLRKYSPSYPSWAEKGGVEAEVQLKFSVLPNGLVGWVKIEESSGFPELDILAINSLKKWRFEPLLPDVPEEVEWGRIRFKFRLK